MKYGFMLVVLLAALQMTDAQEFDNILQNADFELGDMVWSMWVEDGAIKATTTKEAVDDGEFFVGDLSLLINIEKKGGGMRVELHQNPLDLKGGQELVYALWAKADPVRQAKLICNHRADPWTSYGSANITIQNEWQEFWVEFDMPNNDDNAGIYVELRDTAGLTWFDNFRLYEGEYFQEDFGIINLSVEPTAKLSTVWGQLKLQ